MPYSIRIIVVDSYMNAPTPGLDVMYSDFRGSAINQVPILRLFGSTETGKKICLHIHGVFPYLYIPYDGNEDVDSLMYKIAINLDKTINISLNQASSNTQHVYKVSLVSGVPMYGYHGKKHQFFKIHLYNPILIRRVGELLMNPATLGKIYQPHEIHLPFALQFMIDYNLHGMSNILLSQMKFRVDPNEANLTITPELILPTVKKLSVCELEGDAFAEHILNRLEVASGNIGVNPGIAALWADEMQRRRNKGETSQIEHLLELKNKNVPPTKSHLIFKQALSDRLLVSSTDKDVVNEEINSSVYPSETPDNLVVQNASLISSQGPSDLELSLNDTTLTENANDVSVLSQLSETMDEETQNFLKILQSLEANAKEDVEEDSILSQVAKEHEEDKDLDLSMPLEAVTTPRKIVPTEEFEDDNDNDLWNTTLIPQLDGECDEEEHFHDNLIMNDMHEKRIITRSYKKELDVVGRKNKEKEEKKCIKKILYIKLIKQGRHMPLLDWDEDIDTNLRFGTNNSPSIDKSIKKCKVELIDILKENKFDFPFDVDKNSCRVTNVQEYKLEKTNVKKKRKSSLKKLIKVKKLGEEYFFDGKITKKTETQIKSWDFQVKTSIKRIRLTRVMKTLHDKEHQICLLLSKNRKPIFKVIAKDRYGQLMTEKAMKIRDEKKINILSDIMIKTRNHIDPNLHLTLQYPSNKTFLYMYNQNVYPEVTKIPRVENTQDIKHFIISKTIKTCDNNNNRKQQRVKKEIVKNNYYGCDKIKAQKQILTQDSWGDNLNYSNIKSPLLEQDSNNSNDSVVLRDNKQSHEQTHFSREFIDSDNEKQYYIYSSKFLNNIKDNNLIGSIKKQSMDQIVETFRRIESELKRHVELLKQPIWSKEYQEISPKRTKGKSKGSVNKKFAQYDEKILKTLRRSERINSLNRHLSVKCKVEDDNISSKCLFLDGAVDSSSSDEEPVTLKRKRKLRESSTNFSRYSALPVTICSSPKPSQRHSSDKRPVSQNILKNPEEKKNSLIKTTNQHAICDIKRRLIFSETCLQTTVIEENLVCSYSPLKNGEKTKIIKDAEQSSHKCVNEHSNIVDSSSNQFNNENFDKLHESISNVTNQVIKDPEDSEDSNNSFKSVLNNDSINMDCISNSSHSNIFSDCASGGDAENSFFKSPEIVDELNLLTTAEKYDKETNFKAKEGTSKIITPQSVSQHSSDGIHQSSGSSSFGLPTPSQRTPEEVSSLSTVYKNENQNSEIDSSKIFFKDEFLHTTFKSEVKDSDMFLTKILSPAKKAPTRKEVIQSLDSYKIPSVQQNEPFYSNVEDVTGSVEVGYNVLKIASKTTAHLGEFESQTDAINHYRKLKATSLSTNLEWKKTNLNNLALSFCHDRQCTITPVKRPPSRMQVKNWIKDKSKKSATPEKKPERIKIYVPLSPGNNCDEDDEMNISLTLSPCTPVSSQPNSSPILHSSQTPKSSKATDSMKRSREGMLSKSIAPSLRKSLLLSQDKSSSNNSCQITGVSPNNTYGFDNSTENLQAARAVIEHQLLTILVVELHIQTRGDFKPNPEYDSIRALFYSILNDVPATSTKAPKCKGIIAINSLPLGSDVCKVPILDGAGVDCDITYVDSEEMLVNEFLKLVEYWDPDILAGYEVQMLSWGYLIERASILGMNLKLRLNRIKEDKKYRDDGQNELQVVGRIVLDVWRLLRHEIAVMSYTFESVVYHILHRRVPQYSFKDLSFWWDHRSTLFRYRTVQYYLFRLEMILEVLNKLDLIGRTSELARLFGIQFFEVLSRGSQFRVESMMLRLAKPLNFIPVSPNVQQRAAMKAPEYLPLILEPESKLYNDPVIVLDFQSLYPSMIIAYNYCFTTCVGRVTSLGKSSAFEFGATQLKVSRRRLEKLLKKDLLNFSPCGVGFVKKEVRDGILPRMLREILDTRLMVKNSMKENKQDELLQRVLHNRQLGLKLIANVTYGYTAANFSGRMPSVEVGDSVVSKGRETLQRAIEMVENTPEWGARVVYGDTDSLFVLVPGKSRQHAFEVGKKIADAVTKANPDPVKLKLEKVYQPCILQTKKRYVGYMYESPDQEQPVYDAKGIETVRRDGCPAVRKMLEKCLRMLFETKDVSLVKKYVLRQFNKILAGRASIQDLTFAKEYRGASGYRPGACVPSLELARKWTAVDKRNEPRRGERVPYIIVNGPPGLPLIRLVRSPRDLLNDPSLRPNAMYYITKVIIPPINRCFNLIGADLNSWFNQMPRKQIQTLPSSVSPSKKSTISQYFSTSSCVSCGEQTQTGICNKCMHKPQITSITLMEKLRAWERNNYNCNLICRSCTGTQTEIKCVSLDCPVLYRRIQTSRDVQQTSYIRDLITTNDFLF